MGWHLVFKKLQNLICSRGYYFKIGAAIRGDLLFGINISLHILRKHNVDGACNRKDNLTINEINL